MGSIQFPNYFRSIQSIFIDYVTLNLIAKALWRNQISHLELMSGNARS